MKKLLFVFLLLLPMAIQAAEITFTKHITYKGTVDANNQPSGKGKLEIVYNQSSEIMKDVLEGVFNNGVVTNAKLDFAKYNGPLWINKSTFKGTVEYQIAPDGSSVTFIMSNGKFKDKSLRTITATSEKPFEIKRTPHDNDCDTKAELFLTNFVSPSYHPSIADILNPLDVTALGKEKSYTQAETLLLGKDWVLVPIGTVDIIKYPNDIEFTKFRTLICCDFPNGDDFVYDITKKKVTDFKKTYQDAVIEYKETTNEATINFNDNGIYKGTISLGKDNLSAKNIFKKIMQVEKFSDSNISFIDGRLEREGMSTNYTNGKTAEEIAEMKKREQEKLEAFDHIGTWKSLNKLGPFSSSEYWVFYANGTYGTKGEMNIQIPIAGFNVRVTIFQNRIEEKWERVGKQIVMKAIPLEFLALDIKNVQLDGFSPAQKAKIKAEIPKLRKQIINEAKRDWQEKMIGEKFIYTIKSFSSETLELEYTDGSIHKLRRETGNL